jgi:signal transduction histidine kinase
VESDPTSSLPAELLVASFGLDGTPHHRDEAWKGVFGSSPGVWDRLAGEDLSVVESALGEAAQGNLVTHQVVSVDVPGADDPLPTLLHFVPTWTARGGVAAVAVTGELLTQPGSWNVSQTRRHRMETLGRMTMAIAHDLNNLLSGIIGHTELLKLQRTPDEHIQTIERAALDGAAIVRKIQQYVRQEKQNRYEHLYLGDVLEECAMLTKPYWYNEPRRHGIRIELTPDFTAASPILGAGHELREVFVNMILNAVQAMPGGGRIRLTSRPDGPRHVVVVVADTGEGMPPEVKARIFEPLFSTKGDGGTGMGLAVAYGILRAHEADVRVDSAPGIGTRFTMRFPVADDAPDVDDAPLPERAQADARVLIVDDEEMVRSVLARLLKLRGYRPHQVGSAADALTLFASGERFDAVVTDLGMPEMNGRDLARTLRRMDGCPPVVLLSGDTEPGTPDADVAAVLSKPFQIDQVDETLRRVIAG